MIILPEVTEKEFELMMEILELNFEIKERAILAKGLIEKLKTESEEVDPTPYCHYCNSMTQKNCKCGPIADNN